MSKRLALDDTLELPLTFAAARRTEARPDFATELVSFREFGKRTRIIETRAQTFDGVPVRVATYVNEFWTAKQRAAHSLHEVSYRACFKPALPRFFIERLSESGDVVYDPFMGRGTTLVESALLGRVPAGCDVNPLSAVLVRPRLNPPRLSEITERLNEIDFSTATDLPEDLLVFYHPDTLRQIVSLKNYLLGRGDSDPIDNWIRLLALNRLTGHSPGFFSVYTLPPNQAVSVKSQQKINERRKQTPPRRDVPKLILKKSKQLLNDCTATDRANLAQAAPHAVLLTQASDHIPQIASSSVSLVVTSPPFLNIVQYATDNWLRCWFLGIDARKIEITVPRDLEVWQQAMTAVFHELYRVVKPGGHIAFEVGEVGAGGAIKLEEAVLPCGIAAGLNPLLILINDQKFTKTANCWGVDNNSKGTNTNRIVLFSKAC